DGSFHTQQTFAVGASPVSVAVADVNGDGIPDLVTANYGTYFNPGSTVSVLLGNGGGSFQTQQTLAAGPRPSSVVVAGVTGHGTPDLVPANGRARTVSVLLGNGGGSFQTQQSFAAGPRPSSVAVADVNGDGRLDLVAANHGDGTVSVLLGNGDGS